MLKLALFVATSLALAFAQDLDYCKPFYFCSLLGLIKGWYMRAALIHYLAQIVEPESPLMIEWLGSIKIVKLLSSKLSISLHLKY